MWSHTSPCAHISCTDSNTGAGRAPYPGRVADMFSRMHLHCCRWWSFQIRAVPSRLPLTNLMATTDSHRVHRPTDVKVAAKRSWLWINEMFLLHLSLEWQNWMLSTLSCVEGSVLVGDYGLCNVLNQTHGISLFSSEEILTVCSWSSDIFSGVPLPR